MTGKLLVIFMMICNMIAMFLYLVDIQSGLMEECVSWDQRVTIQIDFALGIIFLLNALLRLMAADSFITFLFTIPTIVDIITLPSLFLSVWFKRTWVGLRFFRFFMLVQLTDMLVYIRLLSKSSQIRVAQVLILQIFLFAKLIHNCRLLPKLLASCCGQLGSYTCWRTKETHFTTMRMQESLEK